MNDAMECAAALWGLENPEPVSLRPTKAVYTALSRRFGPVVLKINRDRGELKAEYEALSRLSGRCCCRVYAFDEDAGALLEERILPGTRLREEPDTLHDGGDFAHIGEAIRLLGESLGYPREDVAKIFFMETVLANVWSLEDGEIVDWERLELASRIMNGG